MFGLEDSVRLHAQVGWATALMLKYAWKWIQFIDLNYSQHHLSVFDLCMPNMSIDHMYADLIQLTKLIIKWLFDSW